MEMLSSDGTCPVVSEVPTLRSVALAAAAPIGLPHEVCLSHSFDAHSDTGANASLPVPPVLPCADQPLDYGAALQQRAGALQSAAAEYDAYSAQLEALFPPPPVVIPAHLRNDFSGGNVLKARDHLGRLDGAGRSPSGADTPPELAATGKEAEDGGESGGDAFDRFAQRFSLTSRPNGDIVELDAQRGRRYWEKESPAVFPQHVRSQLLSERGAEESHNFRYYSRRWGEMLKELAATVGGADGAELLRRYEAREESLALPPECRRDFYASVIDYEEVLGAQERMLEGIEDDYEQYVARILDATPAWEM